MIQFEPPAQIEIAINMLSNHFFQTPPFHLSFSMEGFLNWDEPLKLYLMQGFLLSIPSDFGGLPDFLVLVRQLILTENRFWKNCMNIFISFNHFDGINCDDETAYQELLRKIKSSQNSQDFKEFARLFQPAGPRHDFDSFLQVIKRFVTCMFENLHSLPGIRFENDVLNFSPRTQLSPEGIALSARIWQILRTIHSFKISEDLIILLNNKNFEDSDMRLDVCIVYRGFELLLKMIQLIQKSNAAIYTLINAHVLIQTSAQPVRQEFCAMRDLFSIVNDFLNVNNSERNFKDYIENVDTIHYYLNRINNVFNDDGMIISFLIGFFHQDFLQTLEVLLQCRYVKSQKSQVIISTFF